MPFVTTSTGKGHPTSPRLLHYVCFIYLCDYAIFLFSPLFLILIVDGPSYAPSFSELGRHMDSDVVVRLYITHSVRPPPRKRVLVRGLLRTKVIWRSHTFGPYPTFGKYDVDFSVHWNVAEKAIPLVLEATLRVHTLIDIDPSRGSVS